MTNGRPVIVPPTKWHADHLAQLAASDRRYASLLGIAPPPVSRPLPCVHEGPILHPCPKGDDLLHVRECREEYGRTTRERCRSCADYAPVAEIVVRTAGKGIGDMISQLYACVGLVNTGRRVVMRCRHDFGWLSGVSHPGLRFEMHGSELEGVDCNPDYSGQKRAAAGGGCASRSQWYCDKLAESLAIPTFQPARPSVIPPPPVRPAGYAVLSPFSEDAARCWHADRWREVARELLADGWDVVAVDKPGGAARLNAIVGGIPEVEMRVGEHPAKAAALIANAGLYAGNDSGMSHVAGMYGVPGAVVMTHFPFGFVFADYPSLHGAGSFCGAMSDVRAEHVLAWLRRPPPARSLPDVPALIRNHLGQRAVTTEWLFSRLAELECPRVVETGCVRSPEDWTAGYFGFLCGALLNQHGNGSLVSVDNDSANCRTARGLCRRWERAVVVESDSVRYLKARTEPVDLAYLDSLDTDQPGHADHALREAQAVEPLMSDRGLIVFDDTPPDGNGGWSGKGRLAVMWLKENGWRVLPISGYQTVLERVVTQT